MNTKIAIPSVLSLFLLTIGRLESAQLTLVNDFESTQEISQSQPTSGVTATIINAPATGITHGSKALRLTFIGGAGGWPTENITLATPQDWSASGGLAMDVHNPGTQAITFRIKISNPSNDGWNNVVTNSATTIAGGASARYVFPLAKESILTTAVKDIGIRGGGARGPGGYTPVAMDGGTPLDTTQVKRVAIFLGSQNPATDQTLVIDNLHLVPGSNTDLDMYAQAVNDFETSTEQALITQPNGVTYSFVTSPGVTSGAKALRVNWTGSWGSFPSFVCNVPDQTGTPAAADWLGFGAVGVAMDIQNGGPSAVTIKVRVDDPLQSGGNTHCVVGSATLAAGASGRYIVPLLNTWGLGISGYNDMAVFGTDLDPQHIVKLFFYMSASPAATTTMYVDNVHLVAGQLLIKTVDRYGQNYRDTWTGKVLQDSHLTSMASAENSDLAANPSLPDRNTYGGWTGSSAPQLAATGYFRAQQVNGKWWLVDPLGRLFFSVGLNAVRIDGGTFIAGTASGSPDRTNLFTWLPDPNNAGDPLQQFWATASANSGVFSGGGTIYNFYKANLYRKYGSSYVSSWKSKTLQRLKSWGFNTVGNWSYDTIPNNQVPYVVPLETTSGTHKVLQTTGAWKTPMPDPWDSQFATDVQTRMNNGTATHLGNAWCIGYYIDNEMNWGYSTGADVDRFPVPYAVMKQNASTAGNSPAKDYLINQLKTTYGNSIASLNSAWGTSFANWNALKPAYTLPATLTTAQRTNFDTYMGAYAGQYFNVVNTKLKAADPNHLYLGCRFALWSTPVVNAAAQYCDVVSFNIYQTTVGSSWNFLDSLSPSKPCIVGEYHFGATDRGLFSSGLVAASDQNDRAAKFQAYVQSVMAHPGFVGCQWFTYLDQPLLGRIWDGENFGVGFMTVADTPYPEMIDAAREVNATIYTGRY